MYPPKKNFLGFLCVIYCTAYVHVHINSSTYPPIPTYHQHADTQNNRAITILMLMKQHEGIISKYKSTQYISNQNCIRQGEQRRVFILSHNTGGTRTRFFIPTHQLSGRMTVPAVSLAKGRQFGSHVWLVYLHEFGNGF